MRTLPNDARRGSSAIPFATEPVQLFCVDVSDASQHSAASRVDDQQRLIRIAANDDGDARTERRERGKTGSAQPRRKRPRPPGTRRHERPSIEQDEPCRLGRRDRHDMRGLHDGMTTLWPPRSRRPRWQGKLETRPSSSALCRVVACGGLNSLIFVGTGGTVQPPSVASSTPGLARGSANSGSTPRIFPCSRPERSSDIPAPSGNEASYRSSSSAYATTGARTK